MQENHTICSDARAFFSARRAELHHITFTGEDVLSYAKELTLSDSSVSSPRALAHISDAILRDVRFTEGAVSPLYGAVSVTLQGCEMCAPRGCESAREVTVDASRISSDHFCAGAVSPTVADTVLSGTQLFTHAENVSLTNVDLDGVRALQYISGGSIDFSTLSGEELLHGAHHVTISDTVLDGDRIGWYSDHLTLTHCVISGAAPFAHAKNLTLIDCALDPTCTCAFERSEVEATLRGTVPSVRNPLHGRIVADAYGEVLFDDTAAVGTDCSVTTRTTE